MSGENFNLEDDNEILSINSPKASLDGPYIVVHKSIEERWAIVAFDWEDEPRLGIRWFWGNGGNPFSTAHPTWFVIPPTLSKNILLGLPLKHDFHEQINDFLSGRIDGIELLEK